MLSSHKHLITLLWALAGALLFLSFGYTEMQGSDLWWHVAAGRELLQTGTLWMVDDWSYTALGAPWTNHEWLADIIYYQWVQAWGLESLVYWKWLLVISTYSILQYVLTRQSGSYAAGFIAAAIAVAVAAPFIDVRPHLYSLLNFSLLLLLLLNRKPQVWKLALLFVIWVNLHGGFFFGLMALGVLLFPWRDFNLNNFKSAFVVGLVCLFASALNPSGVKSFLYPLAYALYPDSPYRQLGEWLPPFAPGGIRSPLFVWLLWATPVFGLSYALPFVRRNLSIPWEGLLLCALTLAMSLTSRRFIPLFAICFALMSAPVLGLVFARLKVDSYSLALGAAALLFAGVRMQPYPLSAGPAYHYLTAEYTYPRDMLNYIEANDIQGKVFALYNWGGYIHWRSDGKLKVFADGRADTVYDYDTFTQYVAVLRNTPGWLELVEASGAEYFLWPYHRRGMEMFNTLQGSGRWRPVYQDSVSFLLARNTVPLAAQQKSSKASPYRLLGAAQMSQFRGDYAGSAAQAEKVLEDIPYQKVACTLAANSYRALGDEEQAVAVLDGCRQYFPSPLLR